MTTHRTHSSVATDIRSWLDFDQKFLGAFIAFLATVAVTGVELAQHTIGWAVALGQVGPVGLAAGLAYVATSKHKDLIEQAGANVVKVADEAAPLLEAAIPQAAQEIRVAATAVDEINARVQAAGVEDFTAPASK